MIHLIIGEHFCSPLFKIETEILSKVNKNFKNNPLTIDFIQDFMWYSQEPNAKDIIHEDLEQASKEIGR